MSKFDFTNPRTLTTALLEELTGSWQIETSLDGPSGKSKARLVLELFGESPNDWLEQIRQEMVNTRTVIHAYREIDLLKRRIAELEKYQSHFDLEYKLRHG